MLTHLPLKLDLLLKRLLLIAVVARRPPAIYCVSIFDDSAHPQNPYRGLNLRPCRTYRTGSKGVLLQVGLALVSPRRGARGVRDTPKWAAGETTWSPWRPWRHPRRRQAGDPADCGCCCSMCDTPDDLGAAPGLSSMGPGEPGGSPVGALPAAAAADCSRFRAPEAEEGSRTRSNRAEYRNRACHHARRSVYLGRRSFFCGHSFFRGRSLIYGGRCLFCRGRRRVCLCPRFSC